MRSPRANAEGRAVDFNAQCAFQDKSVFITIVGNRLIGIPRIGLVFVDCDRHTAGAVFADEAPNDVVGGFDDLLIGNPHDHAGIGPRSGSNKVRHRHAQAIGNHYERSDRWRGSPTLDQAEHGGAQVSRRRQRLKCHSLRQTGGANAFADRRENVGGRLRDIVGRRQCAQYHALASLILPPPVTILSAGQKPSFSKAQRRLPKLLPACPIDFFSIMISI